MKNKYQAGVPRIHYQRHQVNEVYSHLYLLPNPNSGLMWFWLRVLKKSYEQNTQKRTRIIDKEKPQLFCSKFALKITKKVKNSAMKKDV